MSPTPYRLLAATAALLVVLAVVLGAATAIALTDRADGSPEPRAEATASTRGTSTAAIRPARRATSQVRPERPVSATLPSGTVVPVRAVPTRADGVLDVPDDIRTAGWWRGGARIGDPFGSTLIAAHVDSATQGLGPYAELLSARPGQRIEVRTAHLRQRFTVSSLRLIPQGSLADQSALYAADGARRLTLVTCAGPYVKSRGGYQHLAVVVATPDSDPVGRTR